ncbi:MAG: class I SAM-dependent methyltransferase [Pseudomonadales bacterium]
MADREDWNKRYAAKPLVWSAGPNQLLADTVSTLMASGLGGRRAVDLACGEGRNAIWLAQQGFSVTGIDYSETGIAKARQISRKRHAKVNWIVADLSTFELEPGAYDLVTIVYLHTGADERDRWMTCAAASVAPSGALVYIGHDPRNVSEGVGGPQDIDLLPTASQIGDYLEGFVVDRAEVVERPLVSDPGHGGQERGVDPESLIALDTLMVARRSH